MESWRPVGTSVVPASSSHQTKLKFKRSLTQASVAGGREAGGRIEGRRRRREGECFGCEDESIGRRLLGPHHDREVSGLEGRGTKNRQKEG